MSDEIWRWDLTRLAEAIGGREVSSEEATRVAVRRVERLQPRLNCFISFEPETALARAREIDRRIASGETAGPLAGVPLAHKDMFYRAGNVSTCGSEFRRGFRPTYTSSVLQRLEAAGAVTLGTLNMSEFANSPTGHNVHFGDCRNPWKPDRITGGSSSGSGSAVAARLVWGALGSDTGGSVRIPAALCGLAGLKPTPGRISRHGGMPLSFSSDCFGPLTRTVADCALMTGIIAGADPADPTTSDRPVPDYVAARGREVAGLRIGVPRDHGGLEVDDAVAGAMAASLAVYRDLGAELVEVEIPDQPELSHLANLVSRAEAAVRHRAWLRERPDDYSDLVARRMRLGLHVPATHYIEALNARGRYLAEFVTGVLDKCDALHLPTVGVPAPTIQESDVGAGQALPALLLKLTGFTRPMNFLGLPALSVPAGFAAGLPAAFQLVGRPFAEAMLFALGAAYQDATDWHARVPPLADDGE